MTDIDVPLDEEPAEEPESVEEPAPAPEPEPPTETPETPTEAPPAARWRVLTRVRYTDAAGNEYFCGAGEAIDDQYVGQADPASIGPLG